MSSIKPFVGGNWKSFNDKAKVDSLVEQYSTVAYPPATAVDVMLAPTALYYNTVQSKLGDKFTIALQTISAHDDGAYTGEISAKGFASHGGSMVIIGHSERRTHFGETDIILAEKTAKALVAGLTVVFCIGETHAQYNAKQTEDVVVQQLAAVSALVKQHPHQFVIAYEPVWAIGTGLVPTIAEIDRVHTVIRGWLTTLTKEGKTIRIIYGGSVKSTNASEIYSIEHVNGFLVGGGSLNAEEFRKIVAAVE